MEQKENIIDNEQNINSKERIYKQFFTLIHNKKITVGEGIAILSIFFAITTSVGSLFSYAFQLGKYNRLGISKEFILFKPLTLQTLLFFIITIIIFSISVIILNSNSPNRGKLKSILFFLLKYFIFISLNFILAFIYSSTILGIAINTILLCLMAFQINIHAKEIINETIGKASDLIELIIFVVCEIILFCVIYSVINYCLGYFQNINSRKYYTVELDGNTRLIVDKTLEYSIICNFNRNNNIITPDCITYQKLIKNSEYVFEVHNIDAAGFY